MNTKQNKIFWEGNKANYKMDIISKEFLKYSNKYIGKNCLDIGAGNGALIRKFAEMFNGNIEGIDLAPKSNDVSFGDCTKLKFKDNTFDTVFLTDIIEHLENKDLYKCLKEVLRVLKVGGYAIINTDYNEDLKDLTITCPKCKHEFHRWGHVQSFDRSMIESFLPFDLRIVEIGRIDFGRRTNHSWYKYFDWYFNQGDFYIVVRKVK